MNVSKSEFENFLTKVKSGFRFEYVGGGYFRDKNVPQGIKADILHGNEILDEFRSERLSNIRQPQLRGLRRLSDESASN